MKILIAEDDPVTLESLDACLRGEGYQTVLAPDGRVALERWEQESPDLACLDIMMPDVDGYEVCRQIRRTDSAIPILFLSAKSEEIDVVVGLEIGADDFIRKPFGKHELLARVKSALRRRESAPAKSRESFELPEGVRVFPNELSATRGETEIELSPREVGILQLLHERVGEAVHRDDLLDRCWGAEYYPESRTLDQHIAQLRKRIEENAATPTLIETVRGIGYRIRRT